MVLCGLGSPPTFVHDSLPAASDNVETQLYVPVEEFANTTTMKAMLRSEDENHKAVHSKEGFTHESMHGQRSVFHGLVSPCCAQRNIGWQSRLHANEFCGSTPFSEFIYPLYTSIGAKVQYGWNYIPHHVSIHGLTDSCGWHSKNTRFDSWHNALGGLAGFWGEPTMAPPRHI